jgi:hypothetical protein
MHKIMVGVRNEEFFGWGDVNDYLRHGMKVVALEPGAFFMGQSNDVGEFMAWYFTVILDDLGVDCP